MHNWQTSNPLDAAQDVPSEVEVRAWVVQAARGDRASQKRIYELIGPRIYRVVRRIVGPDEADDVMQDFVMQFFAKLHQFRFESSLETWAHRMAVNQSLQHLRKAERESARLRAMVNKQPEATDPVEPHSAAENAELLEAAMAQISGQQRAILHMKEIEGLGYAAIAQALGIPEGTVGSRLNRARKDLRATLIELGWEA